MTNRYKSFEPQARGASLDGFISGEGQQPRRPVSRMSENSPAVARPTFYPQPRPRPTRSYEDDTLPPVEPARIPNDQSQDNDSRSRYVRSDASPKARASAMTTEDVIYEPDTPKLKGRKKVSGRRFGRNKSKQAGTTDLSPKTKKGKGKKIAKILGILILVGLLLLGGRFVYNVLRATGDSNPFSLLGAFQRAPLKNDNGRVNVLVAGNSADNVGHDGGELTDSIMLLSLDTRKNTGMMLSIPRDMWVKIPGEGHMKINAVYPLQGMDGLAEVIEDELKTPVHYTALVNYAAFKDLVDAVGGITITIKSDNPRGIYDSSLDWTSRRCCEMAKYPNGPAELNGQQALNLARARGEGYGSYGFTQADFTRTQHQRQMLLAIKEKALSNSTLTNPLKIGGIVEAIGKNVKTDLKLNEIQTLYSYMKDIDDAKIDSYNINTLKGDDNPMLQSYTSPNGQSALIPAAGMDDYSEIASQIKRTFTADQISKEAAKIVVLNATEKAGLARSQSLIFVEKGMSIAAQGNATVREKTSIVDNSGNTKPNTIKYLRDKYRATVEQDQATTEAYPNAEIIIILGKDAASQQTQSTTN